MRQLLIYAIVGVVLASGFVLLLTFSLSYFGPTNGYLTITSTLSDTKVDLNKKEVGSAPYRGEGLKIGIYQLDLKARFATASSKLFAGRAVSWSGQIPLSSNLLTAVKVDFGPSDPFTAVEILSLRAGTTSLSLASQPNAKVELDSTSLGQSPLVKDVKSGVHHLKVSQDGYVARELDINVPAGFQTVIQISLSADPISRTAGKLSSQGLISLYDLSTNNPALIKNPQQWAEGVWFFQEKLTDLETKFDALLDFQGQVYYSDETSFKASLAAGKALDVGYLGKDSDKGLSASAQKAWAGLVAAPKTGQVEILSTPTGTLNVRAGPSQNEKILLTVKPGEKYDLLSEQPGWYKIQVGEIAGWISGQYAKKL